MAIEVIIQHYGIASIDLIVESYAVRHLFEYQLEERIDLALFLATGSHPLVAAPCCTTESDSWCLCQVSIETYVLLDSCIEPSLASSKYIVREEPGV